jgi:predicted site-specific integrase-resolvase
MAHPLSTTDELAETFRVNPATVRRWAKAGIITPEVATAGTLRFNLQKVTDELRAHARKHKLPVPEEL